MPEIKNGSTVLHKGQTKNIIAIDGDEVLLDDNSRTKIEDLAVRKDCTCYDYIWEPDPNCIAHFKK